MSLIVLVSPGGSPGVTTTGLPITVQLVAAPGREALLLSLGQQLEGLFPPRRWQPED